MSSIPSRSRYTSKTRGEEGQLTALIPDFPFDYGGFLEAAKQSEKRPLFSLPPEAKGRRVLVVGAGAAGAVAAYELLRIGLKPVLVEASDRYGGRMNAHHLGEGAQEVIAELGCMRFPISGKAGKHYFDKVGMWDNSVAFPNPGDRYTESTVVDYRGRQEYYERDEKPTEYRELEDDMFAENGFLNNKSTRLYEMWKCMTGDISQDKQL
ncbi:MAG TPA: FAD-dependent oxidoreductase, partial [Dyella sp.]|uniref:FAD-dependent oxidoreductase n=1 Tax=Dyella sp. TaxID=1869338 RepID=UPI002C7AFD6A